MGGSVTRRQRCEAWLLARLEPAGRRRRFVVTLTLLSAAASAAFALLMYQLLGLDGLAGREALVAYGLPVVAPLLISPWVICLLVRMIRVVHDNSTRLQDEVRRRQQAEARLAVLVTTDELTGLANRRAFFARAAEIAAGTGDGAAIAILDLDDFKGVNDRNGHAAGDATLRDCGAILHEVVDANGLAARIGGEEFGLILPHRDAASARQFLDGLRERLGAGERVTASIGVADWPAGTDIDRALAAADTALYRAKQRGRNRVEVANAEDATIGTDMAPVARR